jgi:hypothetical protein
MTSVLPESLSYKAVELLNLAIMTKVPVLIVEGRDDIAIYQRLAESVGRRCSVFASENLVASPGCVGVIRNISEIRERSGMMDITPYVLGIIDRDARYYRKEIFEDDALLILHYYSIESHFVSKEAVRYIAEKTTRITGELLSEESCELIFNEIKSDLDVLYLCSLEALKNACDRNYDAELGYSEKIRSIIKQGKPDRLIAKEQELAAFADSIGVDKSWESILTICKGKWVFQVFIDTLISKLASLPEMCKTNAVAKCQYCVREVYQNCMYALTANFSSSHMEQILLQDVQQPSLSYIKNRFQSMVHR